MPASIASKSRKWCFTMYWDGKEPGKDYFDDWECDYMYIGKEICPESRREHYQGYIRFTNPRALAGVRKLFTHTVLTPAGRPGYPGHWEACKGTETQNVRYCAKDEDLVIEWGDREADLTEDKAQGKRNDIIAVREMIRNGANMRDVIENCNSYQGIKIAETMLKHMEAPRDWVPEVYWIYGPTGTGKSKLAFDLCENPWTSAKDGKWFDGYDGHEDVIFDDFRHDFCPFHILLRLLDRYPYRIEHKGGCRQFLAKRIFITSCHSPDKVYPLLREDLAQLGRRLTHIIYAPRLGEYYGMPGSEIGMEPSASFVIPELGTEQKVGGNTTEVSDDKSLLAPALTRPPPGLIESKCVVTHGADMVCDGCENDELLAAFAEEEASSTVILHTPEALGEVQVVAPRNNMPKSIPPVFQPGPPPRRKGGPLTW